jgi:peptidoglycan/LPS O-acetylase OafA/YrhL
MSTDSTTKIALQPTSYAHHRFHFLDAVRGVAALFVVVMHFPYGLAERLGIHNPDLAVDLFFCLSGFVIAFSYEQRLRQGLSFRDFSVARVIRLYPLYILSSLLGFADMLWRQPNTRATPAVMGYGLLCALLMVPMVKLHIGYFLMPFSVQAWSLFFEMVANLVYAAAVKLHVASTWLIQGLCMVSLVVLLRWLGAGNGLGRAGVLRDTNSMLMGLARIALSFGIGVSMLRLYKSKPPAVAIRSRRWSVPLALGLLLVLVLASPFRWMWTYVAQMAMIVTAYPVLIYFGAAASPPASWTKACVFLGEISYPIYLIHLLLTASRIAMPTNAVFAGYFCISVGAAYWLSRAFDIPLRRALVDKYRAFTARPVPAVSS